MTDIYWNSHKGLFSVREKGKVIGHAERVLIDEPQFVVSEAGRQRVLASGQKNVHAFVRGRATLPDDPDFNAARKRFASMEDGLADFSFAVYDPQDECGLFRVLCVIGDIVIRDEFATYIKMVNAYVWDGRPQLKVKMS